MKLITWTAVLLITCFCAHYYLSPQAGPSGSASEASLPTFDEPEKNAAGAAQWLASRRANSYTGQFETKDYLQALQAVKQQEKYWKGTSDPVLTWKEVGPDNIGGRTRALHIDINNGNRIYAGGVAGGLFVSENGGTTWTVLESFNDVLPVGCITQSKDGDLYVGTGEGHYDNYGDGAGGLPGNGIYKSIDNGLTFTHLAATAANLADPDDSWAHVIRMAGSLTDNNTLYAATGSGLYMTTDGGQTWNKPTGAATNSRSDDVVIATDGTVLAAINGSFYRSFDGTTFTNVSNTFLSQTQGPISAGRLQLAAAASDANYVYAITSIEGQMHYVYRSTNQGTSWTIYGEYADFDGGFGGNTFGDQGDYNLAIAVAPDNKNEVYICGQYCLARKSNTNANWNIVASAFGNPNVHADMHLIVMNPNNANELYLCTDGGIFKSTNGGNSFTHASLGYNVTQYYSVAVSPYGKVIGGTQDNGTHLLDFNGGGVVSADEIKGGDGGYTEISKLFPSIYFAASQYGDVQRSNNQGNFFNDFYDSHILAEGTPSDLEFADFVTPFELWENMDNGDNSFVVGLRNSIWLTKGALVFNGNPTWFKIADLGTQSPTVTSFNFTADGDVLYAGTTTGVLYRISGLKNATYQYVGGAFDAAAAGIVHQYIGIWPGQTVTGISVKAHNNKQVAVSLGNYGNDDYVFLTNNALAPTFNDVVWESVQGDLPKFPVYDILIDALYSNKLYIATEFGVYMTSNSGESWVHESAGMGNIATFMIRQEKDPQDTTQYALYAGTHGRGIFTTAYQTSGPGPTSVRSNSLVAGIQLFPNPAQDQTMLGLALDHPTAVEVNVYNLQGQLVHRQQWNATSAGRQQLAIDTRSLSSGQYLVQIQAGKERSAAKLVVSH